MWVYLKVDTSGNGATYNYTKFMFHIGNGQQYAAGNELYLPLNEMDSGTYHVLIEAYDLLPSAGTATVCSSS